LSYEQSPILKAQPSSPSFVTQTYTRLLTNSNSGEGDQRAFLQLGLDLGEHGTLTDGTRNPLYPAFLTLFAQRDWAYFTQAKLLSMIFGVLAIVALYLLGRRFFDPFTGFVAAYLLSINVEFIVHSATVLTESLLVFLFILTWFAMLKALEQKDKPGYWAITGALAGLSYLAKGSAQLLVFSFLAIAFFYYRRRIFRSKGLWLVLGVYALIASPLWTYNTIYFGRPTFNYAVTHQMWMDQWRDWHPDDIDNLPTLATFLQSHSLAEIAERQWQGMKALRNILVKALWPTRTLLVDRFLLSPLSGYTLALLALLPLIFRNASRQYLRQNRSMIYLTLLVTIIFFLLFAWYVPIVALGQRFLLPIVPFIFVLAAHIAGRLGQTMMARSKWLKRTIISLAAIVVILQVHWAVRTSVEPVQTFFTHNVFEQDRHFNADSATPLAWLADQSPQVSTVAWGPSGSSLPTWAYSDRLDFKLYPPHVDTIPTLTQNLVRREVDFIIIAPDMVSRHRSLLAEQFPTNGARVELTTFPTDWALTYAYRNIPCDWCVFRLLTSHPAQHRAMYQIGDSILLEGYDLTPTLLRAGDTLHLTLHWTTTATVNQDITVFTQLLGPDFQLHGQLDHQPIDNLWPTTRWQPGEHLADHYAIPISEQAPGGEYRLLVGMYNGQTGERQSITQNGSPVPDKAIHLATITVTPEQAK
jgi:hypothetical protein